MQAAIATGARIQRVAPRIFRASTRRTGYRGLQRVRRASRLGAEIAAASATGPDVVPQHTAGDAAPRGSRRPESSAAAPAAPNASRLQPPRAESMGAVARAWIRATDRHRAYAVPRHASAAGGCTIAPADLL